MKIYGKSIGPGLKHETEIFENNDDLLNEAERVAKIYRSQPYREHCKVCNEPINNYSMTFTMQGIEYRLCSKCGHLNGLYQDTKEFAEKIHRNTKYAEQYSEKDRQIYFQRMNDIYSPKVKFLFSAIRNDRQEPLKYKHADFGAGSGYMVAGLHARGATAVGYEMSPAQVNYANKINNFEHIYNVGIDEIYDIAKVTDAGVVTMIGVIEHLQYPVEMMKALKENRNVKYVFLTFPMLSPSVYFEQVFPSVMPGHLALGHTHLFQESSIEFLINRSEFSRKAEWWFGTDIMDLVRSVDICVRQREGNCKAAEIWRDKMNAIIDELQLVIDRHQLASQVHMLLGKDS